jgi:hypothetical protein
LPQRWYRTHGIAAGIGRQNRRHIKELRALSDDLKVVLDRVAVVALDTHEHLRLKIDQQQCRIVG